LRRTSPTKTPSSRILVYSNNKDGSNNENYKNQQGDDFDHRSATKTVGLSKHRKTLNNTSKVNSKLIQKGPGTEEDDELKDLSESKFYELWLSKRMQFYFNKINFFFKDAYNMLNSGVDHSVKSTSLLKLANSIIVFLIISSLWAMIWD
jgi:hypothetical protein